MRRRSTPARARADADGAHGGGRAIAVELATVHALTWLVIANAVGLLLAIVLVAPRAGELLGSLTYGRWMPLHLDLELYGWCSLPVIAVLLRLYRADAADSRWPARAIAAWSGTLLFGAVSWLAGRTGGKPFLDWSGSSRLLLAATMLLLAGVLASAWVRSAARVLRARRARCGLDAQSRAVLAGKGVLLLALLGVPFVLYWAASPGVHPPINPATSGPTGASLLGSALAVIAIMAAAPLLAGVRPRDGARPVTLLFGLLALHFAAFAALDHGDRSHREVVEVAAVASVLLWVPLLDRHLRRLSWPDASARWLRAFGVWWGLLVASAVVTFLPGALDRVKFTNVLVGHAHVAMAGALTSFVVLLLQAVNRDTALGGVFGDRRAFLLWHGGGLLMIAALVAVGALEARAPGRLFGPDAAVDALYLVRAVAGTAMLAASVRWLRPALACAARGRRREAVPAATLHDAGTQDVALEDASAAEAG